MVESPTWGLRYVLSFLVVQSHGFDPCHLLCVQFYLQAMEVLHLAARSAPCGS